MSAIDKGVRRTMNWFRGHGYGTNKEVKAKAKAKADEAEQIRKDEMFEGGRMPDEEDIRRNERRKSARRRGSRVSTVLTEEEGLGG